MQVSELFIWFILYSIMGWVYETLYCSIKGLKWDNRGILLGPYCPIYGVGAVLDVLLCGSLGSGWAVFFACMAGSAVLEYATSYGIRRRRAFGLIWHPSPYGKAYVFFAHEPAGTGSLAVYGGLCGRLYLNGRFPDADQCETGGYRAGH